MPFKSTLTSRKLLSCARVLARTSKRIFSIFSSAPTKLFSSIPAPSRIRKRCPWRKRSWNYCRIRTTKSFHSWLRIPTGTWIIAPAILSSRRFFGFTNWPNGIAHLDLGDRTVNVIPTPGHNETHVAFYDSRTGILFSGDFLMPGRLLIEDAAAYRESALRVVDFLKTRPLTHILGGHIELNTAGQAYRFGSHYHPNEHRLELAREDLTALPAAFDGFNGFYARHSNYILTNPIHNLLALAIIAVAVLILIVWGVRRLLRRRRPRSSGVSSFSRSR
ncbi:MAG: MBL fold metallo-hydrolase [Verrucomicrobia bacterium]|nr:MAG: MBL fold metallo-hydrolase [Verrucomicrobiota bacterium]